MNDLNMLLSGLREKMPAHSDSAFHDLYLQLTAARPRHLARRDRRDEGESAVDCEQNYISRVGQIVRRLPSLKFV